MNASATSEIDFNLIKKYDTSGPRYTSYPTAPQFTEEFTGEKFQEEIQRVNGETAPGAGLSLYFHLPFCESVCFFCGCNVTFTSDRKRPEKYTHQVIQEMDQVHGLVRKDRRVEQLHWGGGTPTFFTPAQMRILYEAILKRFTFSKTAEIGLEVDPRETTPEHLEVLADLGFNRLSMGIQDFDEKVQEAVNRIQPEAVTVDVIQRARQLGFRSISVDLIYGLPHQTEKSFTTTLERILALNPDRVAVFNFAYLPEMIRHQKAISAKDLPSSDEKLAILKRAIQTFTGAGYRYIGMDHFARPEDELCRAQDAGTLYRNFQGYTTHAGCDLHAFGVSAISQVGRVYAQNHKNVHEYGKRVEEGRLAIQRGLRLDDEDLLRREIIMRLLCDFGLDPAFYEKKYGLDFDTHFSREHGELAVMQKDGLLVRDGRRWEVTPTGRLLIRNICMPFDAYLQKKPGQKFSRTV